MPDVCAEHDHNTEWKMIEANMTILPSRAWVSKEMQALQQAIRRPEPVP